MWRDPRLIANEETDAGHDAGQALRLMETVAAKLDLAADLIVPAYENNHKPDKQTGRSEHREPPRSPGRSISGHPGYAELPTSAEAEVIHAVQLAWAAAGR